MNRPFFRMAGARASEIASFYAVSTSRVCEFPHAIKPANFAATAENGGIPAVVSV
jgi:hypothetical protein